MNIPLYTQEGKKSGELPVSEKIFGQKANDALVHKMLILQLSNKRHPIAHTLTKGEVRGGGKKPYAQKHTGQARQGSITNPHFRGGGVAFGPRNTRNFQLRASKGERRNALFAALSSKMKDGQLSALEGFTSEKSKTKDFANMLGKLPFEKKVLFVLPKKDELFVRASRNITRVKSVLVNYINIADILKYKDVVFLKDSVSKLEGIFLRS